MKAQRKQREPLPPQRMIGFRLPYPLYEKLHAMAVADDRKVGFLVARIVRERLESKKK